MHASTAERLSVSVVAAGMTQGERKKERKKRLPRRRFNASLTRYAACSPGEASIVFCSFKRRRVKTMHITTLPIAALAIAVEAGPAGRKIGQTRSPHLDDYE